MNYVLITSFQIVCIRTIYPKFWHRPTSYIITFHYCILQGVLKNLVNGIFLWNLVNQKETTIHSWVRSINFYYADEETNLLNMEGILGLVEGNIFIRNEQIG